MFIQYFLTFTFMYSHANCKLKFYVKTRNLKHITSGIMVWVPAEGGTMLSFGASYTSGKGNQYDQKGCITGFLSHPYSNSP